MCSSDLVYVRLPLEFYVGGSYSQLALRTESPDAGTFHNSHRQFQAQLSRRLYRHYLRLSWTGTELNMRGSYQKLTSWEAEDSFNWLGITASAAVRLQRVAGDESKQTYYTRSSLNWNRGRFSAYGNWELGKDLANQSIFATTTATSSEIGRAHV